MKDYQIFAYNRRYLYMNLHESVVILNNPLADSSWENQLLKTGLPNDLPIACNDIEAYNLLKELLKKQTN